MKIGKFDISTGAYLAPMAGVTDVIYRAICKRYDAALTCTEMISTQGLFYGPERSSELMATEDCDGPHIVQIFGAQPYRMAEMAKKYCMHYDIIDINMGCPTPKIVKNGAGSALMTTPDIAFDIVSAVSDLTQKPVTCKIRSGWDDDHINAIEFSLGLQKAGAQCITLHARSRAQFYSGKADWQLIKDLKDAVSIPVIGNGDIKCAQDAKRMIDMTSCDGIMVGRAAQGRPYLFKQIKTYLDNDEILPKPTINTIMYDAIMHAEGLIKIYGQTHVAMMMRKHLAWYIKGEKNAAMLRHAAVKVKTMTDIREFATYVIHHSEVAT